MIEVREISVFAVQSWRELVAEYIEECGRAEIAKPDPQWKMYAAMEASGLYAVFGVYVDEALAGFATVLTMVSPQYGVMMCNVEKIFVGKAHRNGTAFARLKAAVEEHARKAGAKRILWTTIAGSAMEAMFDKRFPRINAIYCQALR